MKVTVSTLLLVLFILTLTSVTSGLQCYSCTGDQCEGAGLKPSSGRIKTCPTPSNNTIKNFCYKYAQGTSIQERDCIQTFYGYKDYFNPNVHFRVHPNSTVGCVKIGTSRIHCLCDEDKCNGSNELIVSTIWSLGIPIIINLFFVINIC